MVPQTGSARQIGSTIRLNPIYLKLKNLICPIRKSGLEFLELQIPYPYRLTAFSFPDFVNLRWSPSVDRRWSFPGPGWIVLAEEKRFTRNVRIVPLACELARPIWICLMTAVVGLIPGTGSLWGTFCTRLSRRKPVFFLRGDQGQFDTGLSVAGSPDLIRSSFGLRVPFRGDWERSFLTGLAKSFTRLCDNEGQVVFGTGFAVKPKVTLGF